MNGKCLSVLSMLITAMNCNAALNVQTEQYKYTSTGCVNSTGVNQVDKITAKAIAKGNLSHELGAKVSAKSELKTITKENAGNIETTDTLTESVSMNSEHYLSGVELIKEEKLTINGEQKYCVTVGIKG